MLVSWLHKKTKKIPGLVCLNISPKGLSLVHLVLDDDQSKRPFLQSCEFHSFPQTQSSSIDPQTLQALLTERVSALNLQGAICSWVLSPQDHALLRIDDLNVTEEELPSAIRWRLKELIDFPVADAVFDVFPLPPCGSDHHQQNKTYVAVANKNHLQPIAEAIWASGLVLSIIDIDEFSLRNYIVHEAAQQTVAVMSLCDTEGEIVICRDQNLYLARRLNFEMDSPLLNRESATKDLSTQDFETLWLEIQRSYDYCESQLGFGIPTKLLVSPRETQNDEIINFLRSHITSAVENIDLNRVVTCRTPLNLTLQTQCFNAIGGALRLSIEGDLHAAN